MKSGMLVITPLSDYGLMFDLDRGNTFSGRPIKIVRCWNSVDLVLGQFSVNLLDGCSIENPSGILQSQ